MTEPWPADPDPRPLEERIGELEDHCQVDEPHRFCVTTPEGAIPNGPNSWWLPAPPPPADGSMPESVDWTGWTDVMPIDETGNEHDVPALGLGAEEPHHRAARTATDEERAVIAHLKAQHRRRERQAAERDGRLDLGGAA